MAKKSTKKAAVEAAKNLPEPTKSGKPVSVITSATAVAMPVPSDFAQRLSAEIAKNDAEIAKQKAEAEDNIPRCGNPKCNKDMRTTTESYSVQDSKLKFCSRLCRYEVLGGKEPAPASVVRTASTASSAPKEPKEPKAPRAVSTEPKAPRQPKGSAVSGILHITQPDHKFSGIRGQVWAMMKEGMKAQDLIEQANAAGLDGKGVLRKLETHFKVVEIKN